MKRFMLFCVVALVAGRLIADPAADYRAGNFARAVAGFEQAVKQSPGSADLWYNLGNAYFKSGTLGKSIVCYERALRLNPGDEDIQHNLAYARSKTIDRVKAVPRPAFVQWFSQGFSSAHHQQWLIAGGLLLWFFVLCRILILWFPDRRSPLSGLSTLLLILCAAATITGILHRRSLAVNQMGILTTPNVYVKSAPDKQAQDVFILHEGVRFCLLDQVGEWMKIRLEDGKVGWMLKQYMEKI